VLATGAEVRYVRGRLTFGDAVNTATFPSAVVVYTPTTSSARPARYAPPPTRRGPCDAIGMAPKTEPWHRLGQPTTRRAPPGHPAGSQRVSRAWGLIAVPRRFRTVVDIGGLTRPEQPEHNQFFARVARRAGR
jgi:hypothetical protein